MSHPLVELKHGALGGNMQSWTPNTKNGRSAYSCRAIYWATIENNMAWTQVSDWRWTVTYTNWNPGTGVDHDETWGDFDHKKKNGGWIYADEVNGFTMTFVAEADFSNGAETQTFAWKRDILGISDTATGGAIESNTVFLIDDDDDEDEEPDCQKYIKEIEGLRIANNIQKMTIEGLRAQLAAKDWRTAWKWYDGYVDTWKKVIADYKNKDLHWFDRYVSNSAEAAALGLPVLLLIMGVVL